MGSSEVTLLTHCNSPKASLASCGTLHTHSTPQPKSPEYPNSETLNRKPLLQVRHNSCGKWPGAMPVKLGKLPGWGAASESHVASYSNLGLG